MAKPAASVVVRLSESFRPFMLAAVDLLQAVEDADPVLLTEDVVKKAAALREVVDAFQGDL